MKKGKVMKCLAALFILLASVIENSVPLFAQGVVSNEVTAIECYISGGQILDTEQLTANINSLIASNTDFVVNVISDSRTEEEAVTDASVSSTFFADFGGNIQIFYNIDRLRGLNSATGSIVSSFCRTAGEFGVSAGYSESQILQVLGADYIVYDKSVYSYDSTGVAYELNCYIWIGEDSIQSGTLVQDQESSEAEEDTLEPEETTDEEIFSDYTEEIADQNSEENNSGEQPELNNETGSDGWNTVNGKWYFYENGFPVKGERKINGKWYYFNEKSGEMTTGFVVLKTKTVYYADTGEMLTGEQIIEGKRYYFSTVNGAMYTGLMKKDNGKLICYLREGGTYAGELKIEGKWYYFDEETGENITGFKQVATRTLYYDAETGVMVTGEKKIDGSWYLFSTTNGNMTTGWHRSGKRTVYYLPTGQMSVGETEIAGSWYLFSSLNGNMVRGWHDFGTRKVYYLPNGEMATGELKIDKGWYFFAPSNGNMMTGFYTIGSRTVYYEPESGMMQTGEKKIDGKWYYFSLSNGAMIKGFHNIGNRTVYYCDEGYILTGEQIIEGNKYYFSISNGAMFKDIWFNGKYYDEKGILSANDAYIGKKAAILGDSISTFTGWIPLGNISRYPQLLYTDGVKTVEQTWWKGVIDDFGMEFGVNISQSGLGMCKRDLVPSYGADESVIKQLGLNGTPDVIFIYMGTNDLPDGVDIGTYENAVAGNVDKVIDSFFTAVLLLKQYYPSAELVLITPYYCEMRYASERLDIFVNEVAKLCEDNGILMVDLRTSGITAEELVDNIHPGISGMEKIKRCVERYLMG